MTYFGVYCGVCHEDAIPLEPRMICGFCDTRLLDEDGEALHRKPGRRVGYNPSGPPIHGDTPGRAAYQKYGCRCLLCRKANTDYERRRRSRERVAA